MKTQYDDKLLDQELHIRKLNQKLHEQEKELYRNRRLAILELLGLNYGERVLVKLGGYSFIWEVPCEAYVLDGDFSGQGSFKVNSFVGVPVISLELVRNEEVTVEKL